MYTIEAKKKIREMGRMAISDEDFNKVLDGHVSFVQGYFKSKASKGFHPQIVGVNMKGESMLMLLADMPDNQEDRLQYFYTIGERIAKESDFFPVCVVFMSEAWMRGQAFKGEKITLPVRDNPAKTEAMIVSGMTLDGRMNMATIPMHKGATGVVILGEPTVTHYEEGKSEIVTYVIAEFYKGYFSKAPKKKGE